MAFRGPDGEIPAEGDQPSWPAWDCSAFDALKPRLVALWGHVFPGDDEHYTSVVVPSFTSGGSPLAPAGVALEERLLFLLIRLRNPFARLVYVTSQPVHPMVIEYYLQLLVGIPASQARRRLTVLSVHDSSPRPLSQKLLERPRLLRRIRSAIPDPERAYLTTPHSTPLEGALAVALGIPLNGPDPRLMYLGTKSWSRRLLREAGLTIPEGAEDLRTEQDVLAALSDLSRRRPGLRAALLKLDDGRAGEGSAVFEYPLHGGDMRSRLDALKPGVPARTAGDYLAAFTSKGGVVEELLEGSEVSSPSVQGRINPEGQVFLTSTHEHLMGDPVAQTFRGYEFPAHGAYRMELQAAGLAVGRRLAGRGVVGRFSVDFVAARTAGAAAGPLVAVAFNLGMGDRTHPMLALRFLTGGRYDASTGLFLEPGGRPRYYVATDNLESEAYRRLVPEDVVEVLTMQRLQYDHRSASGVVFHMLGGVSEQGRLGLVAIGGSRQETRALATRAREVLDREAIS